MIERDVKRMVQKLIAEYEQKGHVFWSYAPVQTGYGKHGVPDFLICLRGTLIAIETKVDCKEPTARQWQELDGIAKAGGISLVVDQHEVETVRLVFDEVVKGFSECAALHARENRSFYPHHV